MKTIQELMAEEIDDQEALEALSNGYKKAIELLDNDDKLGKVIEKIDKKAAGLPMDRFPKVPEMLEVVKSYAGGNPNVPKDKAVIYLSGLLYLVSGVDIIPDLMPVYGLYDDQAVIDAAYKLAEE